MTTRTSRQIEADRALAASLGRDTLSILDAGGYIAPSGRHVDLRSALQRCRESAVEYPPDRTPEARVAPATGTRITVENDTVLAVGQRLTHDGSVAALNFAAAGTPGGGFLSGVRAQEESIARASGLFHSLQGRHMYALHRQSQDPMYSDYVIYSPDVPVFRSEAGELLEEPWSLSILTCPAANGTALGRQAPHRLGEIPAVMTARTAKVLAVAVEQSVERLILGAWGCGAFGLDPVLMAGIFRDALAGPFHGGFDRVVFAITDRSDEQYQIGAFKRAFER